MKKKITTLTLTGLALAAALSLAGCATPHSAMPTGTRGTPASANATPTATPRPSGWEQEQAAKQTYTLSDGTTVPLATSGSLDPRIIKDVQSFVTPKLDAYRGTQPTDAQMDAWKKALAAESAKLHRDIVPVSYVRDGMSGRDVWAVGGAAAGEIPESSSKSAAVTAAEAWVTAHGSDQYVVIAFG